MNKVDNKQFYYVYGKSPSNSISIGGPFNTRIEATRASIESKKSDESNGSNISGMHVVNGKLRAEAIGKSIHDKLYKAQGKNIKSETKLYKKATGGINKNNETRKYALKDRKDLLKSNEYYRKSRPNFEYNNVTNFSVLLYKNRDDDSINSVSNVDALAQLDLDKMELSRVVSDPARAELTRKKLQYKLDKSRARRIYKNEIHRVPFSADYRRNRRTDYKNELKSIKLNRGFSESDFNADNCYNFGVNGINGSNGSRNQGNPLGSKVSQTNSKGDASFKQALLNQANSNAMNTAIKPLSTVKSGNTTPNANNTSKPNPNTAYQNMQYMRIASLAQKSKLNSSNPSKDTLTSSKVPGTNTNNSANSNSHNQSKDNQNRGKNENKDKAEHNGEFIRKIEEAGAGKSEAESKDTK